MRRLRRAAVLAALVPCLAAQAPAMAAPPHAARAGAAKAAGAPAAARARDQVTIALTRMTAKVSAAGDRITVTGTVQNNTGKAVPSLGVRLRFSQQRMTSRSMLDQYAATQPYNLSGYSPTVPAAGAVPAGGKQAFRLSMKATALGVATFGVVPVGVEAVNAAGQPLSGGVTSFVTVAPKGRRVTPVKIGWVWPVIDRMHRTNDRNFTDDQLAKDVAPGGRLAGLVAAARGSRTPVTWAVDPALLDDVRTMATGPYTVRPVGTSITKEIAPTAKSAAAAAWLGDLKTAVGSSPYFDVPYADPDAVALVRWKMTAQLKAAYAADNLQVAADVLGRPADARIAWPVAGLAGRGTIDQLTRLAKIGKGDGALLLSKQMFEDPVTGYTSGATTTVPTSAGNRTAVTYDDELSRIVSQDDGAPGSAVLVQQRFLAETAMISAETSVPRTLVVAPTRHWSPSRQLASGLLAASSAAPWLKAVPLDTITRAAPEPRQYAGYADANERNELGGPYLAEVRRSLVKGSDQFSSIMVPPAETGYRKGVLRAVSASWRGHNGRAVRSRDMLARQLAHDMAKVGVLRTVISLAGRSGEITLTVANDLPPGRRIKALLRVESGNRAKLQIGRIEQPHYLEVELNGGQKVAKRIPVQVSGNGNVTVHADLVSPADGRVFGPGQDITVRTTALGRTALLITGGALAVLFLGVGVRATRARRRRKAEAAVDGSTGGMGATAVVGAGLPGAGPAGAGFPPDGGDRLPDGSPTGFGTATGNGAGAHAAPSGVPGAHAAPGAPPAAPADPWRPAEPDRTGDGRPSGGRHRGGNGG
ncbi:DUF6049 family protein [Actinomadura parmotrematis]|uniref:Secreted protein n=1 Tax=Actinomadura parmotrematis TaxID=2864039 RepID=A0ABS7G5Z3_9ACTN|nr:DUF6049 family protein [Actinomadura parmotrematis]MBW8487058.1 hypothetical protein [Actinomadura parmotrematis]